MFPILWKNLLRSFASREPRTLHMRASSNTGNILMSALCSTTISTASLAPKSLSRSTLPVTPTFKLSQPRASSQGVKVQARVLSAMVNWLPNFGSKSKTEEAGNNNGSAVGWARSAKAARSGCPLAPATAPEGQEIATFAGGCFWGLQLAFDRVPGVTDSTVGYTAGADEAPTYQSVCGGRTGHAEAVQVYYDPKLASYEGLLDCFFAHVDPTTKNRQGGDMGSQYRSGIYYHSEEQKAAAQKKIAEVNEKLAQSAFRRVIGSKVVSELLPASNYYIAEQYHQKYLAKGGRGGRAQSDAKGCQDKIRCYG